MTRHQSPQETQWPADAIFTVGHSTLPIERFIALLQNYGIERLADVRTVPRSRHNPQFNSDELGRALKGADIDYVTITALGGLRQPRKDSVNASSQGVKTYVIRMSHQPQNISRRTYHSL
jgi:uncharacterized protein (DUF488 family)